VKEEVEGEGRVPRNRKMAEGFSLLNLFIIHLARNEGIRREREEKERECERKREDAFTLRLIGTLYHFYHPQMMSQYGETREERGREERTGFLDELSHRNLLEMVLIPSSHPAYISLFSFSS